MEAIFTFTVRNMLLPWKIKKEDEEMSNYELLLWKH